MIEAGSGTAAQPRSIKSRCHVTHKKMLITGEESIQCPRSFAMLI
jgi:hypothetical protein